MSAIKQGQDNQILFTVYTKSTGVQYSGATASQMSAARTLYGVVHGGNTAAVSKSISRAPSLVRSGLFRVSVKSVEVSNFDEILVHIEGNTSLILPFNGLFQVDTVDASDLYSALAVIQSAASDAASAGTQINSRVLLLQSVLSDAYSAVILTQSLASDAASAAAQANSRALVIESMVSDVDSALTSRFSDLHSLVSTTGTILTSLAMSDIASAVWAQHWNVHSGVSTFGSAFERMMSGVSDAASAAAQGNSRVLLTQSMASDIYSAAILIQSMVSDVDSALTSRFSDLHSLVSTTGTVLTASAMSDIASQVWAHVIGARVDSRVILTQSLASDAASAAAQANSRALVIQSLVSDVDSALTSAMAVVQSMASDAASAAQQANSRALVIQSTVSDILSAAIVTQSLASDAASAATLAASRALVATSAASDAQSAATLAASRALVIQSIVSDVQSALTVVQSMASDAASAAQQANSRVLLNQSRVSDIYSLLSDYVSDFGSRVPAALTTLTAVPGDTPSFNAALMFLYHAQKFQTRRNASQVTIGASDGSTMATATVAFNAGTSTFTRGTFS